MEGIESIRHVYLDEDHGGPEALESVENSSAVPKPNYDLTSSPGKFQVVWKVEGMSFDEAEGLLHAMARQFGGDPAATNATGVLRLPGFTNKKYETDFYVKARRESTGIYNLRDFKLHIDSQDSSPHSYDNRLKRELSPRTNHQSPCGIATWSKFLAVQSGESVSHKRTLSRVVRKTAGTGKTSNPD